MGRPALKDETTDLKLHAHLCAERYQGIQEHFDNLERRKFLLCHLHQANQSIIHTVICFYCLSSFFPHTT